MRGLMIPRMWPLVQVHCRLLSSTPPGAGGGGVKKALLSKLRKQTGIPFINCKKALEKFDNDFDEAKKWLIAEAQREGWARATKLQSRPMSQGLVAILGDSRQATMVEVNCETDFVAKNEKFVAMVTKLVQDCNKHFESQSEKEISLDKSKLGQLKSSAEQTTLADVVALAVGTMGENMALRRGTFIRASEDAVLAHYVHPSNSRKSGQRLLLGKYGAIVELRPTDPATPGPMPLTELGSHLCQHIVGMNPANIGEYTPPETSPHDAEQDSSDEETKANQNVDSGEQTEGGEKDEERREGEEEEEHYAGTEAVFVEEEALLQQEFLLDTSMRVGELLCMNSAEVTAFARYACGEEIDGEKEE